MNTEFTALEMAVALPLIQNREVESMERFFAQSEWQGIAFNTSGVNLSPNRPADAKFYDAFYRELCDRYESYDDLPLPWRLTKDATAEELARRIPPSHNVLSYGCGIGYIERRLRDSFGFSSLYMWDFSSIASHFNQSLPSYFLPSIESPDISPQAFDDVYLVQVLYAMKRNAAVDLLRQLRTLLRPGGQLIIMETSIVASENGLPPIRRITKSGFAQKAMMSITLARPLQFIKKSLQGSGRTESQGWGWQRDSRAIARLAEQAGFSAVRTSSAADQCVVWGNA